MRVECVVHFVSELFIRRWSLHIALFPSRKLVSEASSSMTALFGCQLLSTLFYSFVWFPHPLWFYANYSIRRPTSDAALLWLVSLYDVGWLSSAPSSPPRCSLEHSLIGSCRDQHWPPPHSLPRRHALFHWSNASGIQTRVFLKYSHTNRDRQTDNTEGEDVDCSSNESSP